MKRLLTLAALAAALPGCVVYDHEASATFRWNLASCADLAIDRVYVDLFPDSGGGVLSATALCEDGAIIYDGLGADTYSVAIDAVARGGVPVVSVDDVVSVYPGDNVFSYRF